MTQTVSRTFDRAPRALVEGMLSDAYLAARTAGLHGTAPATVTREGGTATVRFPRRIPLDALPGPLRKLAGSGAVTQVETWTRIADDRCEAEWHTESPMPGKVSGTFVVTDAGEGRATYTVTATAKVNVPVIGGSIAKQAEEQVVRLVEEEMDFATRWLAENPDA